tara:strand:- start:858 stop:1226 length:369 start_codon:yes stop_codon:yes gene_type:complete
MKYFISILLLSLCSLSSAAEYGQLAQDTDKNSLSIEAGDVIVILAFNYTGGTIFTFKNGDTYSNGNEVTISLTTNEFNIIGNGTPERLTFVGPGVLEALVPLHYKLTRAPNPQKVTASTPAN